MNNNNNTAPLRINVAIDGTSSSGKSSMAKALARSVGYKYIDTGAMYRATTLWALRQGFIADGGSVDEAALVASLPQVSINFAVMPDGTQHTMLNGEDVEAEIRGLQVSQNVSPVATVAAVRHFLVRQQQAMGADKGVVMDGRDIGTTVLPGAEIKVFVSCSPEVRAERRYKELLAKGDTSVTLQEIVENVKTRDHIDSTRTESPLRQAPDAIVLDSGPLNAQQQAQWVIDLFNNYINNHSKA